MDRSTMDVCAKEVPANAGVAYGLAGGDSAVVERWGPTAAHLDANEQSRWLSRTIETEIIPRLMLAHRNGHADFPLPLAGPVSPTLEQVEKLAQIVLSEGADTTFEYVRTVRSSGVALDAIYLELLSPAARQLGVMWDADLCSFAEVTLGLWRLQQVMHELGQAFQDSQQSRAQPLRAILVPVPGSQHTLGLFMVAEFFRRAGWDVWGDAMASRAEIMAAVRREWFDVIGFSVATEAEAELLASVILEVRKISRNRKLVVIVGGPFVALTPGLVERVGADATAEDAPTAVLQAEGLLTALSVST